MENDTLLSPVFELADSFLLRLDNGNRSAASDRVTSIQSDVVFWGVVDGILVVTILSGNTLTILALRFSRKLRSIISNMFVLSLAISDIVVGFTLPYHLAFYMGSGLGHTEIWCLLRFFLIILACCVSIWNLIAIAVDRYIAIMYPLHYTRYMTKKVALILLSCGWMLAITIAAIPMFWNNWTTAEECEFDEVLPPWYMAGVITPIFSMVWLCLLMVYWRIWRECSRQVKQLRSSFSGASDGPSDWKSVQVVLLILGCFSVCWLPYFIVACIQIFGMLEQSSPVLYKGAFSLAMANSGMNPLIYAWKNKNFRRAFALLLRCQNPDNAYRDGCGNMKSNKLNDFPLNYNQNHSNQSKRVVANTNLEHYTNNQAERAARNGSTGQMTNDGQISTATQQTTISTISSLTSDTDQNQPLETVSPVSSQ